MEFLAELWLPILINGIVLFFASFIAWVILPHHFNDKKKLTCESALVDFVRSKNIAPGNYMFPYADDRAEKGSAEFMQRYNDGPVGCLDVYGKTNMPLNMIKTVIFFVVTSAVIGYITYFTCPPGSDFLRVFRVAGTIGILTHASSGVLNNIWFKRRSFTDIIDGVVFGAILGLIFALMWPHAG